MSDTVIELAVRHVKAGRLEDFRRARAAFLADWRVQAGASHDREFAAVMTLPQPLEDVYVGMTAWDSPEAYQAASARFWGGATMGDFMDTVDMPAFGLLRQTEGAALDLGALAAADGQVLEVAVRSPRGVDVATFDAARRAYVAELAAQPGVLASYEFELLGEPADGRRVGMTVYASREAWQGAMSAAGGSAAGGRFFSVISPAIVAYVVATPV